MDNVQVCPVSGASYISKARIQFMKYKADGIISIDILMFFANSNIYIDIMERKKISAGYSRFVLRQKKLMKSILPVFKYSFESIDVIKNPLKTKNMSTPIKPPCTLVSPV